MSRKRKEMWLLISITLGFFVLSFAIYGVSLNNKFIQWDDGYLIVENPIVQGISLENIKKSFSQYDPELYIPVTFLSYQIDHLLWGMNPFGFHLTNLVLHTMNALLVMMFLFLLLRNVHLSLFVGLLFLVHPLHTEAVAWASARKDVLSSFFFLLSVCSYLQWRERENGQAGSGKLLYSFSIFAVALGLLAKVSIIMLPVILLLIEWLLCHRRLLASSFVTISRLTPYFLLSVMFGIVALFVKKELVTILTPWEAVLMAGRSAMFSLQHLFLPIGLSPIYPYNDAIHIGTPDLFTALVIVMAITFLTLFLKKYQCVLAFSWFFFLLTLAPTFTTFAKAGDVYVTSDRYAYLPSIGIFLMFGLFCHWVMRKVHMRYAPALFAVIILPLSVLSSEEAQIWKDSEALFRHVIMLYPKSVAAQNNLGIILLKQGDVLQGKEHFESALKIRPYAKSHVNLGDIFRMQRQWTEAVSEYEKALAIDPEEGAAHFNIGLVYAAQNYLDDAKEKFEIVIAIDSKHIGALNNLGAMEFQQGNIEKARRMFERALEIDPGFIDAQENLRLINAS